MVETPLSQFNIKKVKLFMSFFNEQLFDLNRSVKIQFQHFTNFFPESNLISLIIRSYYSYDLSVPTDNILLDFHVENIFEVKNLEGYLIKDKGYILPENLVVSLVSVSISHIRALMAQSIAGTVYQENILPIVNPLEVAKSFYPNMFKEEKLNDKVAELTKLNLDNIVKKIKRKTVKKKTI